MKNYSAICFFLAIALILCPLVSLENAKDTFSANISGENTQVLEETTETKPPENVKVLQTGSENVTELSLTEYLIDCVAAEIGPGSEKEAIKAQAVACHTLLLYTKSHKTDNNAEEDITDSTQKLLTQKEQQEKWGEKYKQYREKIESCVAEVENKVLCFDGEPIMSTFFAISNGKTENAENVWNKSLPYLISVESPGDKLSPKFTSAKTFTAEEFKNILTKRGVTVKGDEKDWVGKTQKNSTGSVKSISICDNEFSGTQIRKMFSLNSATFSLNYKNEKFCFTVYGNGHGVGMSQVGANAMAKNGNTYDEILLHYYKNAVLSNIEQ